ncbi:protoporphyrinogen oxidase [Corynebacterium uterequi]|uniref:Coproporphyrinogen III oxidase n=1 Tax=Corynebacterium uterequi TaxID=1072256 RepID=A0A0G3HA89_9CORY|nr:protoporphyrinogen oxidase [Corynebacterium uterequi]AKK10276.1 protoporphyrinogen oxidase [Corynebacterium uterequi]
MRIAIIGAGLAGLTTAVELRRRAADAHIDVFEATDRLGGKLFTAAFASGPTDVGAEAFIARRADAREFFDSLGLGDSVVSPSGLRSLIYSGGETKPLPAGGMMGIPSTSAPVAHLVSAETCARIDAEGSSAGIEWQVGQDVAVGELVAQRYGAEVVDRCVSALLGGVYSCTAYDLGLRATVPALAESLDALAEAGEPVTLSAAVARLEAARAEQMKAAAAARAAAEATSGAAEAAEAPAKPAPIFGAFRGGYAELYEALAEHSGADIYVDSFISGITGQAGKWQVTGGGEAAQQPYDLLVLATPAPTTAMLLKQAAPAVAAALAPVKLADSVVVAMKFDSDAGLPDNSGVLIATDEPGVYTKAFTFSSKKWPHLGQRGGALVRASFGRFGDTTALRTDEDTLVDWALDDLKTITGFDGRAAGLSEIYTQRWFGGLPRYGADHLATVATVRRELGAVPGLELTGAWAGGVGVPAVIADARACAARLLG